MAYENDMTQPNEGASVSVTDTELDSLGEHAPEADLDAEFDAEFDDRLLSIKNPVARFLFGKKYLGLCFLIPMALMALIYIAFGVWPVGEHSALVLDLNAQYVYYIEKFRSIILEGESFLYTFERAVGGEFMGIFAYYVASPFNLLTLIFPKEWMTEVVLAILLLKCGSCGLTFGIYMHNTYDRRRPVATVIFSMMYALCSFAVVMQNNLMWTDCMILLPIILLGMDSLIKHGKFKLYTLSLALAIFSNFYIGYMMCLFLLFYFFVRFFSLSREERNPLGIKLHVLRRFTKMLLFSVIAVMMAMVVITCAYYSLSFGKLEFSTPDFKPEQLYDFTDIISKFFFGAYDTVRPEGIPFVYAGMLMTILMPLYFITPGIAPRRKVGMGFMMALFLVSINLSTADLIWHGFQRPNWLNARFSFMFTFLMLVMAYEVFIRIKELGYGKVVVSGAVSVLLLLILQHYDLEHVTDFRTVWASIGIIGIYLAVLRFSHESARRSFVSLSSVVLAIVVSLELFAAGVVDVYAFDEDVTYSTRKSYRSFLDKYYEVTDHVDELDRGFYREEKIKHRKTNDNFALGIRGLSNSTSTLNASIIELLNNFGFTSKSHWSKYVGGTLFSDSFFGIKYLYIDPFEVDIPDYVDKYYDMIYKDSEGVRIYKNPYALSIAFEVTEAMKDYDYATQVGMSGPFKLMNDVFSMTTGIDNLELWKKQPLTSTSNSGNRKFGVQDNHMGYEKNSESVDGTITYTFTATDSNPVYMYIPSKWPRQAKFSVKGTVTTVPDDAVQDTSTDTTDLTQPTTDTAASVKSKNYITGSTYFSNDTHAIVEIGTFEPGEEVTVTFTQSETKFYVLNTNDIFYSFDEELATSLNGKLTTNQLEVTSFEEDRIVGRITVDADGADILTTIPYDEGWHVVVDGNEIEYGKALDSLMMFSLGEGEHEIEMYYMSESFKLGATVSVVGIAIFVLICIGEKLIPFLWVLVRERMRSRRVPVTAEGSEADGICDTEATEALTAEVSIHKANTSADSDTASPCKAEVIENPECDTSDEEAN